MTPPWCERRHYTDYSGKNIFFPLRKSVGAVLSSAFNLISLTASILTVDFSLWSPAVAFRLQQSLPGFVLQCFIFL